MCSPKLEKREELNRRSVKEENEWVALASAAWTACKVQLNSDNFIFENRFYFREFSPQDVWATGDCSLINTFSSYSLLYYLILIMRHQGNGHFSFFSIFFWSIVDLQCYFNLTVQQSNSLTHICVYVYIHSFLLFFSIMVYHRILNIVLLLYSRTLLFNHSVYKRLHLLTPTPTPSLPQIPSPLALTSLFFMSLVLLLFHLDTETDMLQEKDSEKRWRQRMAVDNPRREAWDGGSLSALRKNQPIDTWISDGQPPELWESSAVAWATHSVVLCHGSPGTWT